jgi:ubiquinone/menaquinone biosynthesis C-methylase UbiE
MARIVRDAGKTIEDDLPASFFHDEDRHTILRMPRRSSADRHDPSRRYHDRVARQYDSIYDDPYWDFHDELTWRLIKPYLPSNASAHCADLGCGTGKWGLRLLKSGFQTTFVDHAASMIEQTRVKASELGTRANRATLVVADIVEMPQVSDDEFELVLAMGDPLSICSDPHRAAREMRRISKTRGVVVATADNKLAALDHFVERGNLDELEQFIETSRTHWLTRDQREQFELKTFTPATLRRLFEQAGFEVLTLIGKTIIPVRQNKTLLARPNAVERLLRLEHELSKDPAGAARAAHLQITVRKL